MKIVSRTGIVAAFLFWFSFPVLLAQPAGYYDPANGLNSTELQQALHDIIDNHTVLSYTPGLWEAVQTTDDHPDGYVWDMYSYNPSGANPYTYTFVTDQCGNYNSEGDCYNREHSFPKSWFGGEVYPMYTDLFHIFPTDGYVNSKRANYPFGTTSSATWTSMNGSRLGNSSAPGYSGIIFEPIDEFKGDFARAHLYMAVRYYGEDGTWPGSDMADGSQPKPWAIDMLMQWHTNDPVSQKETDRNDAVYSLQGNRNPFIDDPSFADRIWGTSSSSGKTEYDLSGLKIWPNPVSDYLGFSTPGYEGIRATITIYSITGSPVSSREMNLSRYNTLEVDHLQRGSYILVVRSGTSILRGRFVVSGF